MNKRCISISILFVVFLIIGCSRLPIGKKVFTGKVLKSNHNILYINLGSDDALFKGDKFNIRKTYNKIKNRKKKVIFEKKKIIGSCEVTDINNKSSELKVKYLNYDNLNENDEIELIVK